MGVGEDVDISYVRFFVDFGVMDFLIMEFDVDFFEMGEER